MSTPTQSSTSKVQYVTSTSDSWESRIQAASTFMGITSELVSEGLKTLGVEKEPAGLEMLSDDTVTPFGDIRSVFCDKSEFGKIPIAKVRMAMKYLRGSSFEAKTETLSPEIMELRKKYGIEMKMEDVDPSELLEHYHPEQSNHPVTVALKKKFGDKPVIVFKPDSNIVDIESTADYIADLAQGFDEADVTESDGVLVRIYAVGQIPNQTLEEDPLFEGKPLKRGRSIVNRINWLEITIQARQFCRIVAERKDIDINDRFQVQELLKLATSLKELKKFYPEADLEYRERSKKNDLPTLTLSMESANFKKQNPFGVNKNRSF